MFAPPTLESVVVPCNAVDKGRLHVGLTQLAEQDPLINLRQDDVRQTISISLYGEVQKEVIQDTLSTDFGIDVEFRNTTKICIERPIGSGSNFEELKKRGNPFLATVGLRIDPAPTDSGIKFDPGETRGSLPMAFFNAVEEAVYKTLEQGIYGWEVRDCTVTMTHSGFLARQSPAHGTFNKNMSSTAGDFRKLTPLVLMNALKQADVTVCEPIHRFQLEFPEDLVGSMLSILSRSYAIPDAPAIRGTSCILEGDIPAGRIHELQRQLPSITRGEGLFESTFDSYQPVRGKPPLRARTDQNPVNREEYLRRVKR